MVSPTKTWGTEVGSSLHMVRVFVDPTRDVLFKILTIPMPPMVRTALIEYGPSDSVNAGKPRVEGGALDGSDNNNNNNKFKIN